MTLPSSRRNTASPNAGPKPTVAHEFELNATHTHTAGDTAIRHPVRDPSTMTPDQRLAELGAILAIGVRRHLVSRETELDVATEDEPTCDAVRLTLPENTSPTLG